MLTAPFAHFQHKARIFTREEDALTFSEATISRLLLANADSIIRRCRKTLNREWGSFEQDHEVDPFDSHARIELHIDETNLFTGSWRMCVYWVPDNEDWVGMHLHFNGVFIWPLFVTPVY